MCNVVKCQITERYTGNSIFLPWSIIKYGKATRLPSSTTTKTLCMCQENLGSFLLLLEFLFSLSHSLSLTTVYIDQNRMHFPMQQIGKVEVGVGGQREGERGGYVKYSDGNVYFLLSSCIRSIRFRCVSCWRENISFPNIRDRHEGAEPHHIAIYTI